MRPGPSTQAVDSVRHAGTRTRQKLNTASAKINTCTAALSSPSFFSSPPVAATTSPARPPTFRATSAPSPSPSSSPAPSNTARKMCSLTPSSTSSTPAPATKSSTPRQARTPPCRAPSSPSPSRPLTYDSSSGATSSYLITVQAKITLTGSDGKLLYTNDRFLFRDQFQSTQDLSAFIQEDGPRRQTPRPRLRPGHGQRPA